jgi:hypothetical protein
MRWQASDSPNRSAWWPKTGLLLAAFVLAGEGEPVWAQGKQAPGIPPLMPITDHSFRPAVFAEKDESKVKPGPEIDVTTTEIRTDIPPVPGATMVLEAGRGAPTGTRFRWLQIDGPPVAISDPLKPSIQITVPAGAEKLAFLLVASSSEGVRIVRVIVPLPGEAARNSWGASSSGRVKADAGDDQVGLVGHRVTLNGTRSRPGDAKSARWLQVAGPSIVAPQSQGLFFSFIPASPGLYRFLLIVAGEGELSEPDEVSVLIGSPPATSGAILQPAPVAVQPPALPTVPNPEQIAAAALSRLPNGTRLASEVADVMEAVAERAALYECFAVLQDELRRRLDVVIPAEPAQRTLWTDGVFTPLTTYTTGYFLAAGLDLRQPQGLRQTLTPAQKEHLRDHFQRLARSFRAVTASG